MGLRPARIGVSTKGRFVVPSVEPSVDGTGSGVAGAVVVFCTVTPFPASDVDTSV